MYDEAIERAARLAAAANLVREQPPPVPGDRTPVWDLVVEDMRRRDADGRARYGTPLQAFNGRDALTDAYQEALDLAVYLRQEIEERTPPAPPVLCARSPGWGEARARHLAGHPTCAMCGADGGLHVHHVLPVHLYPEWELDPANLLTLCPRDHHLCGHLLDWHSYNPHAVEDAAAWLAKVRGRPDRRGA